ncbi:MAG: M20 family metallopeptidase [Acidimicrobiia bacterium]|nr:M20 family metallopeptidase [Acidimicrobiia bacterium]MDH4308179.1 M20 family metallopeptidase [Acidimicrobiia bacterium]
MATSIAAAVGFLRERRAHWVDTLARMVSIDSGPGDTAGAEAMVGLLTAVWTELGWPVEIRHAGAPVLLARRSGPGPRVLLMGHYDTVFAVGTVAARPFAVADGRATGPGASDMKAGLVVQAAAMSILDDGRCDITVMVNGDEESGSVGSRPLIEDLARHADVALVFEPGGPDGAIVTGRPGVRRFRAETIGRPAHTGVEPEKGRNAIEGMAHLVLSIAELGRRGDLGSVTVSMIDGGSRPNIVPEGASIVIDGRVPTPEAGDRLAVELEAIAASVPVDGVTGRLQHLEDRPAFVPSEESLRIAGTLQQLSAELGLDLDARPARGSSDGNFSSGLGVPTIDGLGPPGSAFHTDHEWLEVDGIFTRAAMVASLMTAMGARSQG